MVCLIIVWLPVEDKVCSWEKAHADPHASMSRACVRFFCGDGPPARVPCNARKPRDAHLAMSLCRRGYHQRNMGLHVVILDKGDCKL